MEPQLTPAQTEYWEGLSYGQVKSAAIQRGGEAPSVKDLNDTDALFTKQTVRVWLAQWYREWGQDALLPPELMEDQEVLEHAQWLGLELPERRTVSSTKQLRTCVVQEHCRRHEEQCTGDAFEEPDEEEEELHYSHPNGLGVAPKSGRARTIFPVNGRPVSDLIQAGYGSVVITHRHTMQDDKPTGAIEQEFGFISGIGSRSVDASRYSYEITSLKSWERNAVRPLTISQLERFDNWTGAMERFKSGEYETRSADSGSPMMSPSSTLSLSHRSEWSCLLVGMRLDLDEPQSFVGIPQLLIDGGVEDVGKGCSNDGSRRHKALPRATPNGDNQRQQELKHAAELREYLGEAMVDLVDALKRDLEPYEQPSAQNLVTGEDLDPRATQLEQMAELSTSYSKPRSLKEVRSFCAMCTGDSIDLKIQADPTFEPTDKTHLMECMVWGLDCKSTGCHLCGRRLHPNLETPTTCNECGELIFCAGKVMVCCPKCRCSYIHIDTTQVIKVTSGKATASASAQRDADNLLYHYIRLTGGESTLFESAKDVTDARLKLAEQCGSFFQEDRDYRITPRHAYFGATLKFSAYPDGRDGLVPRDFIPYRSQVWAALMAGEGGANAEGGMDLSMFDDGGEWANLPSFDKLGDWIEKNMPTAPDYPVNLDQGTWLAQEGILRMAAINMGRFVVDAGARRKWEVNQTMNTLAKLGTGIHALSLPDQEHSTCITFNSWFERMKKQSQDFSRSQLYPFEQDNDGWAIRMVYAPTLPKIIQMIRLPKELAKCQRADREVYSGRFNAGGMGLSFTGEPPKNKQNKDKSKKGSLSTEDSQQPAGFKSTSQLVKLELPFRPAKGEVIGDRLPDVDKFRSLTTVAADGQSYCMEFQSVAGCPYNDDSGGVACPHKHEFTLQWHPQLVRVILAMGGFKCCPAFTLKKLLAWSPHQQLDLSQSWEVLQDRSLRSLDKALECTALSNADKRPVHDIVDKKQSLQLFQITPKGQSDVPVVSLSGVEAQQVQAATLGHGLGYVDGNAFDVGGDVYLKDGSVLKNRCPLKAAASQLHPHKVYENRPGASIDLELVRQVNEALLEIDPKNIPPCSWLADVYMDSSDAENTGYSEALWDIVKTDLTSNSNLVLFSQGRLRSSSDLKGLGIRVWTPGNTMREPRASWHSNPEYSSKFLQEWNWGHKVINSPLAATISHCVDDDPTVRHVKGFQLPTKLNKFNELKELIRKFGLFAPDEVEFVIGSQGMQQAAAAKKGNKIWQLHELEAAQARIRKDQDRVEAGTIDRDHNPHLDRTLKAREKKTEAVPKRAGSESVRTNRTSNPLVPPDPPMEEDGETHRRAQLNHPTWRAAMDYLDVLEKFDNSVDRSDVDSVREAIAAAQEAGEKLLSSEECQSVWEDKAHVRPIGRVCSALVYIKFGCRRAEGPLTSDVPEHYAKSLTEGHWKAVEELVLKGHACAKLGPSEGYAGDHREATDAATLQIWLNYWDTGCKIRSFNSYPERKLRFIEEGIPFAPLGVVQKTNDRNEVRYEDDEITAQLRVVTDHTDGGHPNSLNAGVASYRTARQLGTDDRTIAAKGIREENANRGYFIGVAKKDYSGAYTICQDREEDVGVRASEHRGVVNISFALTFGGGDASGVWEILGSAPSDASAAIKWPDAKLDGEKPPRHDRCTDDTLHQVAHRGNRQERYIQGFEQLMRIFAGKSSNNAKKDGESGRFTPKKHTFGSLVDALRRRFITPLSRMCRGEDKVSEFFRDKQYQFTGLEVPSVRGTLDNVFRNAPELKSLVMARFDAMQSDTALRYGSRKPPENFRPSPAIPDSGETAEEGQAMLRVALTAAWHFAVLGNGKYMYRSYEQCLPLAYRDTWPGIGEGEGSRFAPESDSSGEGFMYFDPISGKFLQEWYTEEEREASFDYDREDKGIIITNWEFHAPTAGIPLTIFDHPEVTYIVMRNDNQNVVDNVNSGKACNIHNLECLMFLSLLCHMLGKSLYAKYVTSAMNKRTDYGSRSDLTQALKKQMHDWEAATGKTIQHLETPKELRDVSHWVARSGSADHANRMVSVWKKLLWVLNWSIEQGHSWQFKIPVEEAIKCIQGALDGDSPPLLDRTQGDYVEKEGPSEARKHIERCAKQGVQTRQTLARMIQKNPAKLEKLRTEHQLSKDASEQEVFNAVLQAQLEHTMKPLWSASKDYDPEAAKLESPKVIHRPFAHVTQKIRLGEEFAGQASFSNSAVDSLAGEMVYLSELNEKIHPHLQSRFKSAHIFTRNEEATVDYITQQRIEGVMGGPPCQEHSVGNKHRKGNTPGNASGLEFQRAGERARASYDGDGVAFQIWECSPGVHQKSKGATLTPYEDLLQNNPGMHDATGSKQLAAHTLVSPLTGEAAPVHHSRSIIALVNDLDFDPDAHIELPLGSEDGCSSWAHNRSTDRNTPGRFVMPIEDVCDFKFKFKSKAGIATVGEIDNKPPGYGNGSFPSIATDPANGRALTFTSGGGKWIQNTHNNMPAFTHVSTREAATNYQLRHLPEEFLQDFNEYGKHLVSHAVLGNVADSIVVSLIHLYLLPMTLEASQKKGFSWRISPRDHFLWRTQKVMPNKVMQIDATQRPQARKNAGVSKDDLTEQWHSTAQVRKLKKQVRLAHHKAGTVHNQSAARLSPPAISKQRKRAKPVITKDLNDRMDSHMNKVRNPKRKKTQDGQARHFIEFYEANDWNPLIRDPTNPLEQYRLKRWISYEHGIKGIKGDSIKAKFPAINKLHKKHGLLPPFEYALDAIEWATECKRGDIPSQPKLCVPKQLIELHGIETNFKQNADAEAEVAGMATATDYCLRSLEYSEQDSGKVDERALHWRDVFFKLERKRLKGWEVRFMDRMTLSLLSSKNSLRRCTRTTYLLENEPTNAAKLVRDRYLRILGETGKPPKPNDPVFQYRSGRTISRKGISKIIQDLMEQAGVPRRFVASHSLRRTGASLLAATGLASDEDIKRWGRWTSNAYKLYVHLENTRYKEWAEAVARIKPVFELN